nr:uncharacterized protein LOC123770574 [Procambarus clarkii]
MARGKDGSLALHLAAGAGNAQLVRHLVNLYPDGVNVEDNDGRTPLHHAALSKEVGARQAYDLLKREGASDGIQDLSGRSPAEYMLAANKRASKGPSKGPNKGPPKGKTKGPVPGPSKELLKEKLKEPSREPSRAPSREPSREPSRAPSREPSREPSRAQSREPSRAPSRAPSTEPPKSKGPSRAQTPQGDDDDDDDDEDEVRGAIKAAERDEDFNPLNNLVIQGDGHKLVGRSSKDPEVNDFLKKVPHHLDTIEELHGAAEDGDTRKVKALLDTKHKVFTKDANHTNILHKAVLNGHTDLTQYLSSKHPELIDDEDSAGRTPLHYAANLDDDGHHYQTLLKAGGDDSKPDKSGNTPDDYFRDPDLLSDPELKKHLQKGGGGGKGRPDTKDSEAAFSYYGGEEDDMETIDEETLQKLEEEYEKLRDMESHSMMKKYLTPDVFEKLKRRVTLNGATLLDVIKSGLANPDSNIGLYAPDAESYMLFNNLFDPVIDEYHGGFGPEDLHPGIDFGTSNALGNLNEHRNYVVSTRVRCARSLEGYPFNPLLNNDQYTSLEADVEAALDTLDEDLAGYYRPLSKLSESEQNELLEAHLLFKQGDRFLEAAGACRLWPNGRGIFLNSDRTLVVWVNEEDHMRIISMQEGGDLGQVYDRFVRAVTALGDRLPFSFSQRLGFLNFCPTNLGSAIRASVHIRLPHLGSDIQRLEHTANQYNLQVRGTSGEHSETKDFTFDISNRRRLGLTEIEALKEMYDGVMEIIQLEHELESNSDD